MRYSEYGGMDWSLMKRELLSRRRVFDPHFSGVSRVEAGGTEQAAYMQFLMHGRKIGKRNSPDGWQYLARIANFIRVYIIIHGRRAQKEYESLFFNLIYEEEMRCTLPTAHDAHVLWSISAATEKKLEKMQKIFLAY